MNEDRAARYQRLKRRVGVASLAWTVVILAGLLWTGLSVALGTVAEGWASFAPRGWADAMAVVVYVIGLSLIGEIASLPFAFYGGVVLAHRYRVSNERIGGWLKDQVKSLAISLLLGVGAASLVYRFIRLSPARWWLPAGCLFALVIVGLTNLAPVLLLPLFYGVKPL